MWSFFGKFVKNFLIRSPKYTEYSWDLIHLALSRKKGILGEQLKKHTSNTPNVHFLGIEAICHQTFRSPIPPGGNILRVGPWGMKILEWKISYFCKTQDRPVWKSSPQGQECFPVLCLYGRFIENACSSRLQEYHTRWPVFCQCLWDSSCFCKISTSCNPSIQIPKPSSLSNK